MYTCVTELHIRPGHIDFASTLWLLYCRIVRLDLLCKAFTDNKNEITLQEGGRERRRGGWRRGVQRSDVNWSRLLSLLTSSSQHNLHAAGIDLKDAYLNIPLLFLVERITGQGLHQCPSLWPISIHRKNWCYCTILKNSGHHSLCLPGRLSHPRRIWMFSLRISFDFSARCWEVKF